MLRNILGVIAGIFAGVLVISLVESLGHVAFPPPEGVDLRNPAELKSIMHEIPLAAQLAVLVAWGSGVFVGGLVARRLATGFAFCAWVVGAVLFAGAGSTMIAIPHPPWMIVGAIIVTLSGVFAANHLSRSINP